MTEEEEKIVDNRLQPEFEKVYWQNYSEGVPGDIVIESREYLFEKLPNSTIYIDECGSDIYCGWRLCKLNQESLGS